MQEGGRSASQCVRRRRYGWLVRRALQLQAGPCEQADMQAGRWAVGEAGRQVMLGVEDAPELCAAGPGESTCVPVQAGWDGGMRQGM